MQCLHALGAGAPMCVPEVDIELPSPLLSVLFTEGESLIELGSQQFWLV